MNYGCILCNIDDRSGEKIIFRKKLTQNCLLMRRISPFRLETRFRIGLIGVRSSDGENPGFGFGFGFGFENPPFSQMQRIQILLLGIRIPMNPHNLRVFSLIQRKICNETTT